LCHLGALVSSFMIGLADLLCPEKCAGCGHPARGGICSNCMSELARIGPFVCSFCGRPSERSQRRCRDCRDRDFCFDLARQAVEYDRVVRSAIHRFKYSGYRSLGRPLASLVTELLDVASTADAFTWVTPGPDRVRRSGIDHGRVLAELVAGQLGRPAVPMVARTRNTVPQMKLDPAARRTNLKGAFRATLCPPSEVVVVDDVFTTGSTASEVARVLKKAGARTVIVLSVARSYVPDPGAYT
jgi:competence protein ComFC